MANIPGKCRRCKHEGVEFIFTSSSQRYQHNRDVHGYKGSTPPESIGKTKPSSSSAWDKLLDLEQQAKQIYSELEAERDGYLDKANAIDKKLQQLRNKSKDGNFLY